MRMYSVSDIRQYFIDELKDECFERDKTGQKTIEMLGASFLADEPAIFGRVSEDYVRDEINWYESGSTNINDIREHPATPPQAWVYSANDHGEINSNYGHLIWSDKYYNQYERVLWQLLEDQDTRRATMVYNRPSIWHEYK